MVVRQNEGKKIFDKEGATGIRKILQKSLEVVELHINPGGEIASHSMPMPVTFFVIEGQGVLTLSGKSITLSDGDLVTADPDENRAWGNPGDSMLRVLVIKSLPE